MKVLMINLLNTIKPILLRNWDEKLRSNDKILREIFYSLNIKVNMEKL